MFEEIVPLKRRRTCCRISDTEMCFIVTRGLSEIYDILTHLSFLNIEAGKIQARIMRESGGMTNEWRDLQRVVEHPETTASEQELERAVWNLSLIVGRPYSETRQTYEHLEKNRQAANSNTGLFSIIYHLGKRVHEELQSPDSMLVVSFTPSLMNIIAHQRNGERWARGIKSKLRELGLQDRPLHIISANLHSVVNLVYGFAAARDCALDTATGGDIYGFIGCLRDHGDRILEFARQNGLHEIKDASGSHIDCQLVDTAGLAALPQHPDHPLDFLDLGDDPPVLLVMDYAFGAQAFEVMDCLLEPETEDPPLRLNVKSISIMGKAGIMSGKRGDIMLATAHVIEGTSDNYTCKNDLSEGDFEPGIDVYSGPMITVLGTSLQNRDLLQRFQETWHTIGLEMEGGHYQRAISAAVIKGHIPRGIKTRYAYYASDNPLVSGQTLAAGEMGAEGVRPTYMVTRVILEKIIGN